MARLIQLPNGSWIDPECICRVLVLDAIGDTAGMHVPPRVVVVTRDGDRELVHCSSLADAHEMRDRIAADVLAHTSSGPPEPLTP